MTAVVLGSKYTKLVRIVAKMLLKDTVPALHPNAVDVIIEMATNTAENKK
jgi:predicted ATP-dependent protease